MGENVRTALPARVKHGDLRKILAPTITIHSGRAEMGFFTPHFPKSQGAEKRSISPSVHDQ